MPSDSEVRMATMGLTVASLLIIMVSIVFSIVNFIKFTDLKSKVLSSSGIPGSSDQRQDIKDEMDGLTEDIQDWQESVDKGKGQSSIMRMKMDPRHGPYQPYLHFENEKRVRNVFKREARMDDAEEMGKKIIDLLEKNLKPEYAEQARKLVEQIKTLRPRIDGLTNKSKDRLENAKTLQKSVDETARRQAQVMMADTFDIDLDQSDPFKTINDSLELSIPKTQKGEPSVAKAKSCSAPRYFWNWVVKIKKKMTASDALNHCYKNGGEWIGSVAWNNLSSLVSPGESYWGHMFRKSDYDSDLMGPHIACPKKSESGDGDCTKITDDLKIHAGKAFSEVTSLQGLQSYVFKDAEGNNNEPKAWFAKKDETKESFCFVWRTMLRWGYDIETSPGQGALMVE